VDKATERVARFLRRRVKKNVPEIMTPDEFVGGGWGSDETIAFRLGHHPEVIARIWNALAEGLPEAATVLVCATPALVDPATGRLVAFVSGMSYMVRVPASQRAAALQAGYQNEFTGGCASERKDPPDFGPEWVMGRWEAVELSWVRAFIAPTEGRKAAPGTSPHGDEARG
jgi:hypothetical protein